MTDQVSVQAPGTLFVGADATLTATTVHVAAGGTLAGAGTISADPIEVLGTVVPGGDEIGTLTVGQGEMRLASGAIFDAQVSLAVVHPIGADMSTQLAADQIALADSDVGLQIGGTLAISSLGDRTSADYWAASPVIIANLQRGPIGDTSGAPVTGQMFDAVTPTPPAAGEPALHLGQGLFLRGGTGVTYVKPTDTIIDAVQLDVLVALGGDADGDGKVWLSDWAALRANFGNTATEKTWTDGNFDPWQDDKVWLSDWAALRATFGNSDYTAMEGGAMAVPEPGTIAMLLGLLAGLAVLGRRRRRAA